MALWTVLTMLALMRLAGAQENCTETQSFFERYDLQKAPLDGVASATCPASKCCRAGDDQELRKHAVHTMATGMRMAVSGSLYELRRLSTRLSGSMCQTLERAATTSTGLLMQTYGKYFTRNRVLFDDFFCSISHATAFPDCCNCENDMADIVYNFLRQLVVVALKEQSNVRAVNERYEKCAHRYLTNSVLNDIFVENKVIWLMGRLKRHVCLPCQIRQALDSAKSFVHSTVTSHVSTMECLRGVSCAFSCGCCNGASACAMRPCYSCCSAAVAQCVSGGGLGAAAKSFEWLMKEIARVSLELQSGKSDDVLEGLGVNLSELIMEIYTKSEETMSQLDSRCGDIRLNALSTIEPKGPIECPVCSTNGTKIKVALLDTEFGSAGLRQTYSNLKHLVCEHVAGGNQSCNTCPGCSFSAPVANPSVTKMLSTLVETLPRYFRPPASTLPSSIVFPPFACTANMLPGLPRTPVPTAAKPPAPDRPAECDDEDVNCCRGGDNGDTGSGSGCDGSGGSGGSGRDESDDDGSTPSIGGPIDEREPDTRPPPVVITRPRTRPGEGATKAAKESGGEMSARPLSLLSIALATILLALLR